MQVVYIFLMIFHQLGCNEWFENMGVIKQHLGPRVWLSGRVLLQHCKIIRLFGKGWGGVAHGKIRVYYPQGPGFSTSSTKKQPYKTNNSIYYLTVLFSVYVLKPVPNESYSSAYVSRNSALLCYLQPLCGFCFGFWVYFLEHHLISVFPFLTKRGLYVSYV